MRHTLLALPVLLAGCAPQTMDAERAHELCSERARAAAGPTGSVTLGANSKSGPFMGASIGISTDYLAGKDPNTVYSECFARQTGGQISPYRPAN